MLALLMWGGIGSSVVVLILLGIGFSSLLVRWLRGRKG
jgi:hypothetical protein